MSPLAPRHRYTFVEYLELEEVARVRHEFFGGEIHAMAGGTPEHAALAAPITTLIGAQLGEGPRRAFSSDLKVRVLATGLVSCPDLTVVCGPVEHDPQSQMVAVLVAPKCRRFVEPFTSLRR
jgi:Uma2 family endonuclease